MKPPAATPLNSQGSRLHVRGLVYLQTDAALSLDIWIRANYVLCIVIQQQQGITQHGSKLVHVHEM